MCIRIRVHFSDLKVERLRLFRRIVSKRFSNLPKQEENCQGQYERCEGDGVADDEQVVDKSSELKGENNSLSAACWNF